MRCLAVFCWLCVGFNCIFKFSLYIPHRFPIIWLWIGLNWPILFKRYFPFWMGSWWVDVSRWIDWIDGSFYGFYLFATFREEFRRNTQISTQHSSRCCCNVLMCWLTNLCNSCAHESVLNCLAWGIHVCTRLYYLNRVAPLFPCLFVCLGLRTRRPRDARKRGKVDSV
jgi:hypothetical protein